MMAGRCPLPSTKSSSLFRLTGGPEKGPPIVLLHGFAGSHQAWTGVLDYLATEHGFMAFDLPGHGASADIRPIGNAGVCAKAVLDELQALPCDEYHLAGHSMGGATAAVIALMAPEACRSLTLLAPGGFGPEVNHRLLRGLALVRERPQLTSVLEQFFGWERPVSERFVDEAMMGRDDDQRIEALETIVDTLLDGSEQKLLPLDKIANLPCPTKVIWGTQDQVLPTRHAHKLPGRIAVHVFERVGHMLPQELPAEMAALILENASLAGKVVRSSE